MPGEICDHTGSIWKPSGAGITQDLCDAIQRALEVHGPQLMRLYQPPADEDQAARERLAQAAFRVRCIIARCVENWATVAGGKPGLTLAEVEGVRRDVLNFSSDLIQFTDGGEMLSPDLFGTGYEIVARLKRMGGFVESPKGPQSTHSPDFRSVDWFGTRYTFSRGRQADAVRVLWGAWENGGHSLSQETVGDRIEAPADNFELAKVFRRRKQRGYEPHPAWGSMIQRDGKGCYRLAPPESAKIRK